MIRGVVAARAEDRVTLYTGNDDHIVLDLAMPFVVQRDGARGDGAHPRRTAGALERVDARARCGCSSASARRSTRRRVDAALLALDAKVTDCNAAFFDVANGFAGCIAGCHEVLRRQGLLAGIWCLDPRRGADRPGRRRKSTGCCAAYPELSDDAFVRENLARWLA